jgi:hypothetical protein
MESRTIARLSLMSHGVQDAVGLEIARRVAARLRASPDLLSVARENLARWSRTNANTPSLLRCYAEWTRILERPLDDICDVLCAENEEGQRLRQNSPFAGILSPSELWEIKSRLRRNATTPA